MFESFYRSLFPAKIAIHIKYEVHTLFLKFHSNGQSSQRHQIEGEIIEIGSRIVSYPKQMNPQGQIQMWGKEVFVQIPHEKQNETNKQIVFYPNLLLCFLEYL